MKIVAPLEKNEKKISLFSMTFINKFEGNCGTFGEKKKTHCCQRHSVSLPKLYIYNYYIIFLFFKQ
jgi:hypothetical protein